MVRKNDPDDPAGQRTEPVEPEAPLEPQPRWQMWEAEKGWTVCEIVAGERTLEVTFTGPGAKEAADEYLALKED